MTKTIALIPGGNDIPVTKENRLRYILLVSNYRLNKQIRLQSNAFFDGLSEMIDPNWLRYGLIYLLRVYSISFWCSKSRMFNQQKLQILLGGVNSPIDLDDLRAHAKYGGLYDDHEPTIQMFWRVRHRISV